MMLKDKVAVIHGGGGAIGGATARAFAREGAHVFLAGRSGERLETVARDIVAAGGRADVAVVDALDEGAVERHTDAVIASAGRIDIALNAVGLVHVQGPGFTDVELQDFLYPVEAYARSNFITAKAAAQHMVAQGSGVILTLSTPGAKMTGRGFLGNGVSSAAVEAFSRILAGELGEHGIRVVCLRPHAIPEAVPHSHTREVFGPMADGAGVDIATMLDRHARSGTLLKRLPTLAQVADVAAFVASDHAGAMTGAIVNLNCGALVD
jgi:NAD(P)-dependent dehydrogenase (short-subunit alcohol dehydrogenase family)